MSLRQLIKPLVITSMLLREWWQSGIMYNPISPRVFNDPYPIYAALRAKDPVHWSILTGSWVLTRYHCLGAALARLEARIAFEALLDRFGEMPLRTAQPAFKDHIVLRGLRTLPVSAK